MRHVPFAARQGREGAGAEWPGAERAARVEWKRIGPNLARFDNPQGVIWVGGSGDLRDKVAFPRGSA
ncbi:hypothetical protein GCM10017643_08410 [Ancylobacter dichloromethanicus]|uniref:Uncharacterized protein n=1 Tax=Ancylobacter dichloromethanicus TaxID=518825 RepID=A0A9W6J4K5_9HYPH|nr:hypothetical protein GCM10017643_08410 [Ancylobacter dichloromethanicus]